MTVNPTRALVRGVPRSYVAYYARQGKTVSGILADEQHLAYRRVLEAAGLEVTVVEPDEALADCVFIEDTAVVWKQQALITRMCAEREGEQAAVESALRVAHTIVRLPPDARLDGGDILHAEDVTYVGQSGRTNLSGATAVREFLSPFDRRVVTVPVTDCLHLKTGMTYLGNGTLLAVPNWFDVPPCNVSTVLWTQPGEAGAANCLRIREHLIIPDGYPQTGKLLEEFARQQHLTLHRVPISEFETGGGSLSCLSIIY